MHTRVCVRVCARRLWSGEHVCEVRRYSPFIVAEVVVDPSEQKEAGGKDKGPMRGAASAGFRQVRCGCQSRHCGCMLSQLHLNILRL